MEQQRQAYLLRVLRSHRTRPGKLGEQPARKWSTFAYWALFCFFLAQGAVFANLLLSAFYVLFLGALDVRAHWGLPGGSFETGRGVVRYFGGLGLFVSTLMLNSHLIPSLSVKLLFLSGASVLAVPLIEETFIGYRLLCQLGWGAKRQVAFNLMVFATESDRARLALAQARQTLRTQIQKANFGAMIASRPRTYP